MPLLKLPVYFSFLCSQPTGSVMPLHANVNCAMYSPPFAIIARWQLQDACWRATLSGI